MERKDAFLWLKSISGISTKTIEKLQNEVGNIENLMEFSDREIYTLKNINLNIKENIVKYKSNSYLDELREILYKNDVKYFCIDDDEYPSDLKHIYNAPILLFYRGDLSILNDTLNIAMVGSRKPTRYGVSCAKSISKQLSNLGVNIISGLAIGIDSFSHIGCMEGKGKTVAVLGSSANNPLPRQNIALADKILDNGGLILSEYNVNSAVIPSNFVNRNRIISGLSKGVIVVEAARKSGALITVEFALDQGRNVFAIPGNINSEMSKGCNKIIKEGAKLIEDLDDIINEYNISCINKVEFGENYDNISLNKESITIINAIKNKGALQIDDICDYTGMEIKSVNTLLNELSLKDIIIEGNNNTYSLNV